MNRVQAPVDLPQRPYYRSGKAHDLYEGLRALTNHHLQCSDPYRRIVEGWRFTGHSISDLPYLPVSIFKRMDLASIRDEETYRIVTSSGTTGMAPSAVRLDRATSQRMTEALHGQLQDALDFRDRLPMLILDSRAALTDPSRRSARAAAILGMMPLGRDHTFAFSDAEHLDLDAIRTFVDRFRDRQVLLFGFTFMAWAALIDSGIAGLNLHQATLIHSGGWKRMAERGVSNERFKEELRQKHGIGSIRNFYGMAEQVGSVFLEGDDGLLHTSAICDIIVRDPRTLEVVSDGNPGLLQVLSLVPLSYPGHSLLTEDLGVIHQRASGDPLGGTAFTVLGRIPKSELRGCSDTRAAS